MAALTGGESIVVAPWPTVADTNGGATKDEVAARRIEDADKLITELRRFRSSGLSWACAGSSGRTGGSWSRVVAAMRPRARRGPWSIKTNA